MGYMEKRKVLIEIDVDIVDLLAEEESCMVAGIQLSTGPKSCCHNDEDVAAMNLGNFFVNEIVSKIGISKDDIKLKI